MAHSYSKIKLYQQCPAKYKFVHLDKLPEPKVPAMERGKKLHKELELAVKDELILLQPELTYLYDDIKEWKSKFAVPEMEIALNIGFEQVPYDSKDAHIRFVLDLYYEDGYEATILDYKTGKKRDYLDQLTAYSMAIFTIKPHIETVRPVIEYIDHKEREVYPVMHRSSATATRIWLNEYMRQMENDEIMAPCPTFLCNYCHFRKGNGGPCKW